MINKRKLIFELYIIDNGVLSCYSIEISIWRSPLKMLILLRNHVYKPKMFISTMKMKKSWVLTVVALFSVKFWFNVWTKSYLEIWNLCLFWFIIENLLTHCRHLILGYQHEFDTKLQLKALRTSIDLFLLFFLCFELPFLCMKSNPLNEY